MKILICSNTSWSLVNFRSGLIKRLVMEGHDVICVSPRDSYVNHLAMLNCRHVSIPIRSRSRNVLLDIFLFVKLFFVIRRENPSVCFFFTIKPNIYGSLVSRLLKIPSVANVAGLGTIFSLPGPITVGVKLLYRFAFVDSLRVFFQNEEDFELFRTARIVNSSVAKRLPGSGVDTKFFAYEESNRGDAVIEFLFFGRLLREKGIQLFSEAARIIKEQRADVKFSVLGFLDRANPDSITKEELDFWVSSGWISYLGHTDDVRSHVYRASCVVLPSTYREGVPRSLLEAASMGRPIITTNAIGCRDAVIDGISGYICRPNSKEHLIERIFEFLLLNQQQRIEMGKAGRKMIEENFSEEVVLNEYLDILKFVD